jgi:hypothetical protein
MRLAIADPPYPPFLLAAGGPKPRASRWYGDNQRSAADRPADHHPDAALWDDPATHRALMLRLADEYDGWAIATSWDGLYAYGTPPVGTRILVWVKPNAQPGSHRIANRWEPVITYPPAGRRSSRTADGMSVADVLTAPQPGGFVGQKPPAWTRWILDALGYDPDTDTVADLFPGSGAVLAAVSQGVLT